MVFQDGERFANEEGRWRVPVVFDNLIHHGDMPVTIGIFVDPGVLPARSEDEQPRFNRSFEYDALGPRYARFLIEEILPEVAKTYNLSPDPNLRAIGGSSSGAAAAFTAAWNRPDAFRRVLSFIGSYTGLRGGDGYPTLVRKTEPRPLRLFLQDGSRDLNIYSGNWWLSNQALASALDYAGYDVRFVQGDRGHDANHGSAILPSALRWLWRDWPAPIVASTGKRGAERHFATDVLEPDAGWEAVTKGYGSIGGLAVDPRGDVYFTDAARGRIHRIDHLSGEVGVFKEGTGGAGAIVFGPDARLYAAQPARKRIVAYTPDGAETTVADGVDATALAMDAKGRIWLTGGDDTRVWLVDARRAKRVAQSGLELPAAVALSPDQSLLAVAGRRGRWVGSFQVAPDGALKNGEPFYRLETADDSPNPAAQAMTVDSEGNLYVATALGIQVFDPPGRVNAILNSPAGPAIGEMVFGGPELDTLYVSAGDTVFRRRLRRKGVFPWQPVKPPAPRL
jgi:sugar lactone lactonase YvrE/enterochelin esterase-like enzyme